MSEHIKTEEGLECGECGAMTLTVTEDAKNGEIRYHCSTCGYDDWDDFVDVYGSMSVGYGGV